MAPIRILQVINGMDRGGAETVVMNLYRHIDHQLIQFDFLVHTTRNCVYDDEIQALGGKIFRAPSYRLVNHFSYCKWLQRFFEAHPEYHIIHGHQYSTAAIYLSVAKKYGLVTIAHSHSTSNGFNISAIIKNMIQRPLYRIADYRIACSQAAGEWLYRGKADFQVLPNSIDTNLYRFSPGLRDKTRSELKIAPNAFVIGHVGRFCKVKNHTMLLNIFTEIHEIKPQSKLLLVGDGPLRKEIEQKAAQLGLMDAVLFTGIRSDVAAILQAMDIFVFPSLYEGLPVTLIEAQAVGLPCVIADHITQEVCLTKLIHRKSLKDSIESWARMVYTVASATKRQDMQTVIQEAGYDIQDSAKTLMSLYLNL